MQAVFHGDDGFASWFDKRLEHVAMELRYEGYGVFRPSDGIKIHFREVHAVPREAIKHRADVEERGGSGLRNLQVQRVSPAGAYGAPGGILFPHRARSHWQREPRVC